MFGLSARRGIPARPVLLFAGALLATPMLACSAGSSTAAKSAGSDGGQALAGASAVRADAAVGPRAPVHPADWPTYHHGNYRVGVGVLVPPVRSNLTKIWNVKLDGAVYASPITAQGTKIVVTEHNTVYRIAGNRVVWSRHLGSPVSGSQLPCGNINPSGITSTPAYDAATSTVVVVALLNNPVRHIAYGIDPVTGKQRWSRNVDVPGEAGITPSAMQQRGALLTAGGRLYVPYGGLAGDCSTYRGSVVSLDLHHPISGALAHYTIPTSREAGIWAPAGPSSSLQGGILVSAGNGATAGHGSYDYSDSVLRLVNNKRVDSFSPSTWRQDNADDLDLGSQGPTVMGKWIFIAGKRGTAYVLNASRLGGIGGQVSQRPLCRSFGGTAVLSSVSTIFVPCTDGLRAVRIGSTGKMTVLWQAKSSITGSPVIGGGRLWSLDTSAGELYSLSPTTGAVLGHWHVGPVSRFATPALWRNTILIGTLSGVVCFSWK